MNKKQENNILGLRLRNLGLMLIILGILVILSSFLISVLSVLDNNENKELGQENMNLKIDKCILENKSLDNSYGKCENNICNYAFSEEQRNYTNNCLEKIDRK